MRQPAVYIMANRPNGTLYTGVTSNLARRVYEHREKLVRGFTSRYGCKMLVWHELHETMIEAITREKQIKGGSRGDKIALIEALNPSWRDLYSDLARNISTVIASVAKQSRANAPPLRVRPWIASLRSQ